MKKQPTPVFLYCQASMLWAQLKLKQKWLFQIDKFIVLKKCRIGVKDRALRIVGLKMEGICKGFTLLVCSEPEWISRQNTILY